jgi:diguanylate cyclase (GGDEF)-like protein/PAS domain S-box-containing protein
MLPGKGLQFLKPLAMAITGYSQEEFKPDPSFWLTLVHKEDQKKLKGLLGKVQKGEIPTGPCHVRWVHKNRYFVCTELWLFPVYKEKGALIGIEAVARDTTVRDKLEEELKYRNQELEILNQVAFSDEATLSINDFLSFSLEMLLAFSRASEGGIYLLEEQKLILVSRSDGFNEVLAGEIIAAHENEIKVNCSFKVGKSGDHGEEWILLPIMELKNVSGFCLLFNSSDNSFFNQPNQRLLKAALNGIGVALTRKKMEESLRLSEEKYKEIIQNITEGFFEMDLNGKVTFFNDSLCSILGYSRKELRETNCEELFLNSEELQKARDKVLKTGNPERGVVCPVQHKKNREIFLEISLSPIKKSSGLIRGCRGVVRDITERKKAEDNLIYLSTHDYLTGLNNRAFFEEEMQRLDTLNLFPITVITCDVDGLKIINDTLGHEKGDELLCSAARVLKETFSCTDATVARTGGDEFAVLLPGVSFQEAEKALQHVQGVVENYNRDSSVIPLSISMGAASTSKAGDPLTEVFQKADNNMYRDKLIRSARVRSNIVRALMATLAERDFIAQGHAHRLQELVSMLGTAVNLNPHEMNDLNLLAQVHDIGKVGVPDNILLKPGRLNSEEWEAVKRHCEIGYRIARSSPELSPIAELILHHHEWWNGEGYPQGLKGEEIHICNRILAIADAYDAIVSERPYQSPRPPREALRELQKYKSVQFDPFLVDIFVELMSEKI